MKNPLTNDNNIFTIDNNMIDKALRKKLEDENIRPAEMARRLGISEVMMSLMLSGKRKPGRLTISKIAKLYPDLLPHIFNCKE